MLGADFLANYHLLVDVAGQRLINIDTFNSMALRSENRIEINSSTTVYKRSSYNHLIDEYKDVFKAELQQNPGTLAKHGIYHYITTQGAPVHSRFRRLPPQKFQAAKAAFQEMERMGICTRSRSQWSSPLHMVPKPDGSWRPCGDYRKLNMKTVPDHYPLPNIQDLMSSLHGAKIFSKLDLLKGYFQVPVNPDDVEKTCIITPFGSYVFHYSTFGLRNSGATFQRLMDIIFGDIDFCIVYVDDILVFSKTPEEHESHLRTVLQLLQDNGLLVRPDKCVFGVTSVNFLGHCIDQEGFYPLEDKVKAVSDYPKPKTNKELQQYLGLINYYHRFVPKLTERLKPLYDSIAGKPKSLTWGPDQESSFNDSKSALSSVTRLHYPIPNAPIVVTTDASSTAVGGVLEQIVNGHHQPLSFFSKKLRSSELKYSTFDRELLAIYLSLRHFKHFLEGVTFKVRTDHRPLITAIDKKIDAFSSRQQRQLSAISEFSCALEHISGKNNPAADALSRAAIDSIHLGIDYRTFAAEQGSDDELQDKTNISSSLQLKDVPFDDGVTILCDISTGKPRPLVPVNLRKKLFDLIHGFSHPSIRSTLRLMTSKFVWNGIARDVRSWTRACIRCQESKIYRHTESGIQSYPTPRRRFGHVHVDIVGPLPVSNGCRYLFTVIDRATRWPEATPLPEATANSCARAFLTDWVSIFGVPDHITSDRGSVFVSDLWKSLAALMGSQVHCTTAYNPESNGMIERFHRSLKQSLTARCSTCDWFYQLPWTLLGLRTTPKADINVSPAEMVFGDPLVVPGEFFPVEPISETLELQRARFAAANFKPINPRRNFRNIYIPRDLMKCEFVFVRKDSHRVPLTPPYQGPYQVIQKSDKAFLVKLKHNHEDWVSIDRLKPAYLEEDLSKATCSKFGRTLRSPNYYVPA